MFSLGAYPFGHVGRIVRWYERVCEAVGDGGGKGIKISGVHGALRQHVG